MWVRECVQRERTYKRKGERGVCVREMKKVCVCVCLFDSQSFS